MKRSLSSASVVLLALGVLSAAAWSADVAKLPVKKWQKKPVLISAEELIWKDVPPGMQEAILWGNPQQGAYGALDRWKGGTGLPLHWQSSDSWGIVVSGTLVFALEGQDPREFGPGSHVELPGKTPHTTSCKEGEDCVFYIEQPGKSDFVFVNSAAEMQKGLGTTADAPKDKE